MAEDDFRALWVEETGPGRFQRRVIFRKISDLPAAGVLVQVQYSSVNYKDALSASGNKGVTRRYPHTPGIDAAGVVAASVIPEFHPGDKVILAAGEAGVSWPGGFGQYTRVPADWLIPLPPGLTAREAMSLGTAGFTAALMVDRMMAAGVKPDGDILVTGATGGVGSIAVSILAREGYRVVAATGKVEDQRSYLQGLGAAEVIHRDEVNDSSAKPLLSGRWAGVIDTVGGNYLATAIRATRPLGVVAACGNAASPDLPLTVYPFILRGVSLLGIDVTHVSREDRVRLWGKLGREWKPADLDGMVREIGLDDLDQEIGAMLVGKQARRLLVNLNR